MSNKIYFENTQGRVEMFLGGAGPVRVTALSGLGNPEKRYSTVTFAGKSGQKTLSATTLARTIIISGDIVAAGREHTEMMLKVLDEPGTLVLDFGNKKRKTYCNQVDFSIGARHGNYTSFVLTLTADSAYFTDVDATEMAIFNRDNLIYGDIIFPCTFTRKYTEAIAENFGEVNVEPVISIYNYHDSENEESGEIVVENLTTGQKIKLETGMSENEIITIDIQDRKVTSTRRGNITKYISDDTFLNKFWLAPGKNHLRANHSNIGEEISVICSYFSNYREGIF